MSVWRITVLRITVLIIGAFAIWQSCRLWQFAQGSVSNPLFPADCLLGSFSIAVAGTIIILVVSAVIASLVLPVKKT